MIFQTHNCQETFSDNIENLFFSKKKFSFQYFQEMMSSIRTRLQPDLKQRLNYPKGI